MITKPWLEGPLELLKHGLEHLQLGTDFDARIAMISIDNPVELTIKTYLGLPSRTTGIEGLTTRRFKEISQSFPSLLDGLEEFAKDKVEAIDLGDIEWYHRLRNQLYHEGNGITVEKAKVEGYAAIAKILFLKLFQTGVDELVPQLPYSLVGEFLSNWSSLWEEIGRVKRRVEDRPHVPVAGPPIDVIRELEFSEVLPASFTEELGSARSFRNRLVHGFRSPPVEDLETYNSIVKKLLKLIRDL